MLLGFEVKNFRSFKDRQSFTLAADRMAEHLDENTFETGVRSHPRLLRSAVIYGPNAGGKTNFARALHHMQQFVLRSADIAAASVPFSPFKLSRNTKRVPSEFSISFIHEGIRFDYGFSLSQNRVEHEWLTEHTQGGERTGSRDLFDRQWIATDKKYVWKFSSHFKGQRSVWSEATRPEALFLSTAVQLNSAQLKPVFEWFHKRLVVIGSGVHMNPGLTFKLLNEPDGKGRLLPFLKEADLGIADVKLERSQIPNGHSIAVGPGVVVEKDSLGSMQSVTVSLSHESEDDGAPVAIEFSDESAGTKILFETAGAWLNVLENGEVLVFDEIDTNLHPRLLRFLVSRFHNKAINTKNAQLICTTHNTSLLDRTLLRRDQVWFVEKDGTGASKLYPLSDFNPRTDENLELWYNRGKYGAQPILPIESM